MIQDPILSAEEADRWWRWMVRVGAPEFNSLRRSHEALRTRVATMEAALNEMLFLVRQAENLGDYDVDARDVASIARAALGDQPPNSREESTE